MAFSVAPIGRSIRRGRSACMPLRSWLGNILSGQPYFVIRTCGLYGRVGSRSTMGSFVETMLRLAAEGREIRVVGDQVLTPTSAKELATKVRQLVATMDSTISPITGSVPGASSPRRSLRWCISTPVCGRRPARLTGPGPPAQPTPFSIMPTREPLASMTCATGARRWLPTSPNVSSYA